MPKEFFTERDIDDFFKQGIHSLRINDNTVLTELAYERAQKYGMQLIKEEPYDPPAAPVRPYLTQEWKSGTQEKLPEFDPDLATRIRDAVNERMGSQVDPSLLDVIIQRVLKITGTK